MPRPLIGKFFNLFHSHKMTLHLNGTVHDGRNQRGLCFPAKKYVRINKKNLPRSKHLIPNSVMAILLIGCV